MSRTFSRRTFLKGALGLVAATAIPLTPEQVEAIERVQPVQKFYPLDRTQLQHYEFSGKQLPGIMAWTIKPGRFEMTIDRDYLGFGIPSPPRVIIEADGMTFEGNGYTIERFVTHQTQMITLHHGRPVDYHPELPSFTHEVKPYLLKQFKVWNERAVQDYAFEISDRLIHSRPLDRLTPVW
jgi:hypothetical protein